MEVYLIRVFPALAEVCPSENPLSSPNKRMAYQGDTPDNVVTCFRYQYPTPGQETIVRYLRVAEYGWQDLA